MQGVVEERGPGKRAGDTLDESEEREAKRSRSQLDANAPAFLPPAVSMPTPAPGSQGRIAKPSLLSSTALVNCCLALCILGTSLATPLTELRPLGRVAVFAANTLPKSATMLLILTSTFHPADCCRHARALPRCSEIHMLLSACIAGLDQSILDVNKQLMSFHPRCKLRASQIVLIGKPTCQ